MNAIAALVALLTLAAGFACGFLVARGRGATALAERDAARRERDGLRAERDALDERLRAAERDAGRLQGTLAHQERAAAEQAAQLERTIGTLKDSFAALSAEALRQNNHQFVQLAEQHLKRAGTEASGDLAKRQQAIESLVAPLRDTLGKVETQLLTVEKERVSAYTELRTQVGTMRQTSEQLRVETASLVNALRAPQVRGRWGEMQLRRVVESAGMVQHCDFVEQATSSTSDGVLRPDLVVKLAGGKNVVVDSKVPFAGYLEAMEARDDATRAARLTAHARHLKEHIDRLAAKSYWERFDPTPEFVVLFVPADAFLNAALEEQPALQEHAFDKNVVIATPSTLIALLRTVSYTWRQEALAENAHKIHLLGRDLHGRLATMGGHMTKLGVQLNNAVKNYNATVSSLEGRVLVTARKLTELQVSDEVLAAPPQIEMVARQPQAPELVASATDALVSLRKRDLGEQQEIPDTRRADAG
jgi:DNA recombination protein RmuC